MRIEKPWASVFLAIVHLIAGTAILLMASWFIAACAVAGVGFNYMLPAVIIRALALLRIASGYAQMWLGHRQLLDRLSALRLNLFAGLENVGSISRGAEVDALTYQTEQLASVWIGWVGQNAGAILSLLLTQIVAWVWQPQHAWLWGLFSIGFTVIYATLLWRGIAIAHSRQRAQTQLQSDIEHHVDSVSLWHMRSHLAHPSLSVLTRYDDIEHRRTQWAMTLLQLLSLVTLTLMWTLSTTPLPLSPVAIILPLALLSASDWLGRVFATPKALQQYRNARKSLACYENQKTPGRHSRSVRHLELVQFKAQNTHMPEVSIESGPTGLVLIRGSSGSGKSRLLQAINGLLPHQGQRLLNGEADHSLIVDDCVYIEQSPYCLSDTLRNNLLLAAPEADEQSLRQVLDTLALDNLEDLEQWVGTGGRTLSGGELKRLGLARAVLSSAHLLLIDEPFEGLDEHTAEKVVSLLNRLAKTRLLFVASHIFPATLSYRQQIDLDNDGGKVPADYTESTFPS